MQIDTEEERLYLYKCVLRFHKEKGSLCNFIRLYYSKKCRFLKSALGIKYRLGDDLLTLVWSPYSEYLNKTKNINDVDLRCAKASLDYIKLLETLDVNRFKDKNLVCELIKREMRYLSERINNDGYNSEFKKNLYNDIREVWEKHKKKIADNFLVTKIFEDFLKSYGKEE